MLKIFVVAVAFCCVLTSIRQVNASCKKCYGKPCAQDPKDRVDCGYPGITNEECINKHGCCWDYSNKPQCYCPAGKPCSHDPKYRVGCGNPGISNQECTYKYGCCWDEKNRPHCFCPSGDGCLCVPPKRRVKCGNYDPDICEEKGCCWDKSFQPQCFNQP
ncbi:putative gastrointestinal growth factor xP4 [Dendronephthya gigantea]|uniref:putative gastrointestinal growth factor xP4 n=1 Tax=Dendronephthya gigantea TaxID=151771 RepID=UPI00106C584A|nr:putative gastrointestinal growth factor xP4 [Dendronephthya gigantea]